MKKILFALSIGFTSFSALTSCIYAQGTINTVAFTDGKAFKQSVRDMAVLESLAYLGSYVPDSKNINSKAIKDFNGRYGSESNPIWFSDKNGFVSYFVKDGFGDRVFYDKKGRLQYSLIFIGEDKLPRDVRATVKSTYFDLNITQIEEVQTLEGTGYVIVLEDKSTLKTVRINRDGEMETMQDLVKQ